MCEAIDSSESGNDTFAKLYAAANIFYNYSGGATCFDLQDNSDPHGLGGWQWQVLQYIFLYSSFPFCCEISKSCRY